MVLITRAVGSSNDSQISAEALLKPPQLIIEHTNADHMVTLLRHLGQVSEFAAEIFNNLFKEASSVSSRLSSLGNRVVNVENHVPAIVGNFQSRPASSWYASRSLLPQEPVREESHTDQLFSPLHRPEGISQLRNNAAPPPALHLLDSFAGKACLSLYSDPSWFFTQWLKAEEERLAKAMQEAQTRKAKKKKKVKKAPAVMRQVEQVQVKVYSAQGKEFDDLVKAQQAEKLAQQQMAREQQMQLQQGAPSNQEEEEDDGPITTQQPSLNVQKPVYTYNYNQPQPVISYNQPHQPYHQNNQQLDPSSYQQQTQQYQHPQDAYGAPPPVPAFQQRMHPATNSSSASSAPVPPPFQPRPSSSVPEAPPIPTAPLIDMNAPAPPPIDSTIGASSSSSSSAGSGNADLMSAIRNRGGGGLKKVEASSQDSRPQDARGGMLDAIRNRNFQLKKVNTEEAKPAPATGGLASVMQILSRRAAIQGSSDDEEEAGDDWE